MLRAANLTQAHHKHLGRLFAAHPRLKVAWDALQDLYGLYEADDLEQAHQALGRFADLYNSGDIPEYHDVVDKIITWGEEILAYHPSRRASNGPLEGINNLLQVLRRVAHGFTNYQTTQPEDSSHHDPDTGARTPKPTVSRSLKLLGAGRIRAPYTSCPSDINGDEARGCVTSISPAATDS